MEHDGMRGVPKRAQARMQSTPLAPRLRLPMGHGVCEGCTTRSPGPNAVAPTGAIAGAQSEPRPRRDRPRWRRNWGYLWGAQCARGVPQ